MSVSLALPAALPPHIQRRLVHLQGATTTNKQIALAFIERINAHDVEGLGALMSEGHTFIDAHGNQISGKEKMIAGWRGYFE